MAEKLEAVTDADRALRDQIIDVDWPGNHAAYEHELDQIIARHRLTATPDRSDDALAEENRGRPFSEWHEDHGQVLWWKLPVSEAPYCGSPLDLGRTMEVTVQIGREQHVFPFVNTGGWPFSEDDEADLWWTPLPKPTFYRAALKGDGL